MSNSKLLVDKIKGLMSEFGFASTEEPKLISFSIEDEYNTIIQVEKLEQGNKVLKINEEFNQEPLEDGTYILKENFEIEVGGGEIIAVKEIFVDAKLSDGTIVKVEGDVITEGAKILVITEEGEIPAPDGVHELEDGSKIETKDGIIVKLDSEVETPEEEVIEEPTEEVKMEVEADEIIGLLKEFISALEEKYSNVQAQVEEMKAELNEFKKQPAGKPIKNGKTDFSKENKVETLLDARVSAILSQRNK